MDELENLQGLLNELLAGIQSVIQSGEILTDEFQGILAQELDYLTTRIDELLVDRIGIGGQVPDLDPSMPSSVIEAFKYDPKKQKLFVQFKGKYPNAKGNIYSYEGVTPDIVSLFQRGAVPARTNGRNSWGYWFPGKHPSMGASMNVLLKGLGLPFRREY